MLWLLAACSLTRVDWTPCAATAECQDAFGFGYTCAEDGLCAPVAAHPRCARTWPADLLVRPEDYRDSIPVGSLFDHSADVPEINAVQLAVDRANASSGLDGRPFGLVQCTYEENPELDGLSTEEAVEEVSRYLAGTVGAPVLIGPATSTRSEIAYTTVVEALGLDVVLISPSATSPALTNIDGTEKSDASPGRFWRTAPPDDLQGTVMAQDIRSRDKQSVAAIYELGPYGEGLVNAFVTDFASGSRVVEQYPFDDVTARDAAIQAVGEGDHDEVVFVSSEITDIVAFLNGAGQLSGYDTLDIFLADGARDAQLLAEVENGAHLLDQVRGTAPSVPAGPVYDAFASAYSSEYSPSTADESNYSAHTWDATWLALYGIAWSQYQEGAITGTGIARGLRRVSEGPEVTLQAPSWIDVTAYFAAGEGIDVLGASGELDFDPVTEETTAPIDVWAISDGAFTVLYTTDP